MILPFVREWMADLESSDAFTPVRRHPSSAIGRKCMVGPAATARGLLLLSVVAALSCRSQTPVLSAREAGWQSDFTVLEREFPSRQVDVWARMTPAAWAQGVQQLRALPLASLSDAEIAQHIQALLAQFHDGHLRIFTGGSIAEPALLPVRFRWFPSGFYITGAASPELLGAQLLQLNGTPADALLPRLAPWLSVENTAGLHAAALNALSNIALLKAAGLVPHGQAAVVQLRSPSGTGQTLTLSPQLFRDIHWVTPGTLPLYRQPHSPENWSTRLPGRPVLYLRYAECHDEAHSRDLAHQLEAQLQAEPGLALIVDLRGNEGGDSAAFAPLLSLIRRQQLGQRHKLAALIDRNTFSSAFRNAVELKQAGAMLLGEASGQRPIYTGNVKNFTLPYSRLQIRYTTKWSRLGPPDALELPPDIAIQPTPAQYLRGEDPVLGRALSVL